MIKLVSSDFVGTGDTSRNSAMPERPWWKRSNCISNSGSRTRRASRAGLRRIRGKTAAAEKGTRRTAPLPAWAMRSAHCPLRPGHCPLRQRIVRMPITPPQCGLSPERNAPPCCLLRAPRYCSQLSALSAPLSLCALSSALRSQRRFALSAPLSASPISRSPSLSAVTTTLRSQLALSLLHSVTTSTAAAGRTQTQKRRSGWRG